MKEDVTTENCDTCRNCKLSEWNDDENMHDCKYANFMGTPECKADFEQKN